MPAQGVGAAPLRAPGRGKNWSLLVQATRVCPPRAFSASPACVTTYAGPGSNMCFSYSLGLPLRAASVTEWVPHVC